jgi:hypothetical protein
VFRRQIRSDDTAAQQSLSELRAKSISMSMGFRSADSTTILEQSHALVPTLRIILRSRLASKTHTCAFRIPRAKSRRISRWFAYSV